MGSNSIHMWMKYPHTMAAWVATSLLFMGGASVAGTWVCSDLQGNEVYTDHNGPRCREFQPTNPDDIEQKPKAKPQQAPKRRAEPAPTPVSPVPRPFGERKSSALPEGDRKEASYSDQ